jgi:alkylation response protein AidB-like acyl-CoA dehydrogenase
MAAMAWSEEQEMFRAALRRFVDAELMPDRMVLEHGDALPYDHIRRYYDTFEVGVSALDRFARSLDGTTAAEPPRSAAETLLPMIELSRCSPGLVTAMGVSVSLAAGAILRSGTREQKERWVPGLLTFDKVGAWAITEPDSGSDAFGGMRSTARPTGDGWVLNGSKTFITNGPHADTIIFICKLDDGSVAADRKVLSFVLDRGLPGLEQSRPLAKMGLHSSPTGELFLQDVEVGADRLLDTPKVASDDDRTRARATFATERASVACMALGIIERCTELAVDHARSRMQFRRRIGDFQQIQLKLAHMEVARQNVENLVLRHVGMIDSGERPTLAGASAMKLYSAQAAVAVSLDAVQVFGGNGYMAENPVEQLCRDAKVLQIYGGTDEIQVTHIARDLLGPAAASIGG